MIEVFESSYTVFLTCIESKYEGNNKNPESSDNTFPHVDQIPSITGTPSSKCSETQPRSQSSSTISDVTSPVKLVGKVRWGAWQIMANPKPRIRLQPKFLNKWKKASEIGWDSLINDCHQIQIACVQLPLPFKKSVRSVCDLPLIIVFRNNFA